MRERRLKALELFERKPMPAWGPDLSHVDFDAFKYYVRPTDRQVNDWEDLPEKIRDTYDRLGIPEAEKARLVSGVAAQYESEVVYQQIQEDLERQGVIFTDTDTGLREYPEFFEKYFGKCVPTDDNKFSALNTAAWSGGSFVYVPKGLLYFRTTIPDCNGRRRKLSQICLWLCHGVCELIRLYRCRSRRCAIGMDYSILPLERLLR